MSGKTPAELQLEFLKKLKEQQQSAGPKPRPRQASESVSSSQPFSLSASRTKRRAPRSGARKIPLSEASWKLLKEQGIDTGKLKFNQALGDKAVELLLKFVQDQK